MNPILIDGLGDWRGRPFIAAGLLVLIATPVMRIPVSILGFVDQKDRTFVAITSVVLALLLLSFALGRRALTRPRRAWQVHRRV